MSKKAKIKRPLSRKKSGATCPDCGAEMLIMAVRANRHVDPIAGESLVERSVKCPACGTRGVNQSHTRVIRRS